MFGWRIRALTPWSGERKNKSCPPVLPQIYVPSHARTLPVREHVVPFANILSRSRTFCPVRELDPIGKLANEHEFKIQFINLKLHTLNNRLLSRPTAPPPPYIAPLLHYHFLLSLFCVPFTNSPASSSLSSSAYPPLTPPLPLPFFCIPFTNSPASSSPLLLRPLHQPSHPPEVG